MTTSTFSVVGRATGTFLPIVAAVFTSFGISQVKAIPATFATATSTGSAVVNAFSPRVAFAVVGSARCIMVGSAGVPVWPSGVPYAPLTDSWQMQSVFTAPLATDMESGSQRLRSKPGSGVQVVQFDVMMTLTQWTTFEAFCRQTLGMGASRFSMIVWLGDAFSTQTVQFEKGKSPTPIGVPPSKVRVTLSLRVFL